MSHNKQQPTIETEFDSREESLGQHLVSFSPPDNPTPIESAISMGIVRLDHRSIRMLGTSSAERGEIRLLLGNVVIFLANRQPTAAGDLLRHAEAVYYQHVQAKNRLWYLGGILAGIVIIVVFGVLLRVGDPLQPTIPAALVPLILVFAGMGSITSVLTRLSAIDLRDQTNLRVVFISGMARPVTGAFLGIVICVVLALRLVEIHVGVSSDTTPAGLFLIAAFMSGFSERFAQDILAAFEGKSAKGEVEPASRTGERQA